MNDSHPPNKQHYYQQIWIQVHEIPYGTVATYGQIAKLVSIPEGVSNEDYQIYGPRWIGMAMAACPGDVPWHRVINSQGKISHPTEAAKQKRLLESEGIVFFNERIDLREHQWPGPGQHLTQGRLF